MKRTTSGRGRRPWLALVAATALLALLSATVSLAQSGPDTMNFQGRLLDNSGDPLGGRTHCMRFRICADADCIKALWPSGDYEYHQVTTESGTYKDGLFNVALGSTYPVLPILFYENDDLYLEIGVSEAGSSCDGVVETYAVMSPLSQLHANGYAQRSRRVHTEESDDVHLLSVTNTGTGGAIYAETDSTVEAASAGYFKADAETGRTFGLEATNDSTTPGASGAFFSSNATTGATNAVLGLNLSSGDGATAGAFIAGGENAETYGVGAVSAFGYGIRAQGGAGDLRLESNSGPGTIYADEWFGSDMELHSNDFVDVHLDDDSNSESMFRVLNGADEAVFAIDEAGSMTGGSHDHDATYVNEGEAGSVTAPMIADGAALTEILDDDGSGSGLDADTLDGLQSSAYQLQTVIASAESSDTTYLGNSCSDYCSVDMSVGGPGSVIVEANVQVALDHAEGHSDGLALGIWTADNACGDQYDLVFWEIPAAYPSASDVIHTFTVRAMFDVDSAGTYTYYLNGSMDYGYAPSTDQFLNARIIAVFYPD